MLFRDVKKDQWISSLLWVTEQQLNFFYRIESEQKKVKTDYNIVNLNKFVDAEIRLIL